MSVNKSIEIKRFAPDAVYKSRVEVKNQTGLWIATPMQKSIVVTLSVGEHVEVSFGDDTCIYSFPTVILKRVSEPVPMLLIEEPDEKKIVRVQRRDFVRVNAVVPIEFGIVPHDANDLLNMKLEKANTIDISGGGLKFLTEKKVREKDMLQINLSLNNNHIITFGKVVRVISYENELNNKLWAIGVQFTNIHESERDNIIRFVFDWQRQMRKKGLL